MKSEVKEKVLMVENPLTGKMINILPMLEFLSSMRYSEVDGGKEGHDIVDKAIQVIYTGKHINLKPLFNLAFNLSESNANANLSIIKKKIEEVIRLISTSQFREEAIEEFVKDMTHNLYMITDMFEEMENF